MRMTPFAATAALTASIFSAALAQAQGGSFMWCMAWTENDAEKAYFYSAFFSAGAWEAERKALAFKNEVEGKESGGAMVKTTCMAPAEYDKAVATRNAAMKAGPGKVLSWAG